jgi:hypothetical protein
MSWVGARPFGVPVVPEEYEYGNRLASSSGQISWIWECVIRFHAPLPSAAPEIFCSAAARTLLRTEMYVGLIEVALSRS